MYTKRPALAEVCAVRVFAGFSNVAARPCSIQIWESCPLLLFSATFCCPTMPCYGCPCCKTLLCEDQCALIILNSIHVIRPVDKLGATFRTGTSRTRKKHFSESVGPKFMGPCSDEQSGLSLMRSECCADLPEY